MQNDARLEAIRIIEEKIAQNSGRYGKYQLWTDLPKKMSYQDYLEVIEHLRGEERIELKGEKLHWL